MNDDREIKPSRSFTVEVFEPFTGSVNVTLSCSGIRKTFGAIFTLKDAIDPAAEARERLGGLIRKMSDLLEYLGQPPVTEEEHREIMSNLTR